MGEMSDETEDFGVVLHGLAMGLGSIISKSEEAAIVTAIDRLATLAAEKERLMAECETLKKALQREAH